MAALYGNGNPFHPYYQRGQYEAYLAALEHQRYGGIGYQPEGMQPNQGYYHHGYNQYQYQEAPMGAQNYQNPNYHYRNDGMDRPARAQQRPVLVEQDRYGQAANTGRQHAQPAPGKENKKPGTWEVEWGEEGTISAPRASRANLWRPKDDKILLKMRAGDKPAPWSEIVGTLYDKHTEDDARRRCDELEAFAEAYGNKSKQQEGPRAQKKQMQPKSFDADDEPSSNSSDENYISAKKRNKVDKRPQSQSRKPRQAQGQIDKPRMSQQAGETTRSNETMVPRQLSRGPSGIAGWTRYPKKTDQMLGKRIVEVSFGLFGVNVNPSEETGVMYRKW